VGQAAGQDLEGALAFLLAHDLNGDPQELLAVAQ
jgi:hypothetical protein